ncbi:hypothetical protein [Paractinoplanes maris]|uniref:hypothetical protein n=1 Tax=Paractinoplanes maris TaxID=1734446 RepID=UPI0020207B09|nr:hypothetical protein [Actinoplanes maris]
MNEQPPPVEAPPEYAVPAVMASPAHESTPSKGVAGWLLRHRVQPVGPAAQSCSPCATPPAYARTAISPGPKAARSST